MIRYVLSEGCNDFSVKPLGLGARLLVMRRRREMPNLKIATNGSGEDASELRNFFHKQVGWDVKRYYPMNKKQVFNMRRIFLRCRYRSLTFRASVAGDQAVYTLL